MAGIESETDDPIVAKAVAWHIRVEGGDMGVSDWEEFTLWLEQNAGHSAAYNSVVNADDDLTELLSKNPPHAPLHGHNDDDPGYPSRRGFLIGGSAIAAAFVAGIMVWTTSGPQFDEYSTAPRETRSIAVSDAIHVDMNGATHLTIAGGDVPIIRLESGEATFRIDSPHAGALQVGVGDYTLVDNGTVFNVIRHESTISLFVAEGEVIVNPAEEAVSVAISKSLEIDELTGTMAPKSINSADALAWIDGQLAYSGSTAKTVFTDLGRNLGVAITVDPQLSQQSFTGTLQLSGATETVITEAAELFGARAQNTAQAWVITSN